jgi:ubiquinone biosynthesis monooxygenase Coq7
VQRLGQEGLAVFEHSGLPRAVVADLRTDHAGETGAVWMYHGVLFFARDEALREFAQRHRVTEQAHLRRIETWLPPADRSRLLPVWRLAGWLTGAMPAMLGPKAVYATIEAVERFVDQHYADQISRLRARPDLNLLRQALIECQADELAHRDEAAAARGLQPAGWLQRSLGQLVHIGSQAAVAVCRHV